ncbi:MAG: histidine kinase [Ignavibacteria bacterium]
MNLFLKNNILKYHIAFWVVLSSITIFDIYVYSGDELSSARYFTGFARIFSNILTFYLFYSIVTQKFFNRKGIIYITSFGIIYISIFGFIYTFITFIPIAYVLSPSNILEYTLNEGISNRIFGMVAYITTVAILGVMSKVSLIWYRNQLKQKETEQQNISNELAMLKAQINPHFLFNTLNNIKSLIKSIPSKAIDSIDRLTGIMQYMIFDSSAEKVLLESEIKHIENYIDLEKIRYNDPGFIEFKVEGDFKGVTIPPLIFMPFIENAFKHGNKLKPSPGIIINLIVAKSGLCFETTNYLKDNIELHSKNSGFGLANIRRRLDLLFGNKYELLIADENNTFNVNLKLNLL